MPQLVALAIVEIGASLYAYQVGAFLIQYSTYIAYAVVAAGTYASIKSMQKMPAFGNLQSEASGKITMTRDTIASRRVIYGINRVSGPIIFASTNSSGGSGKNEFLHIIVALAGHEVSEFKNIFFNDVLAWSSGSGQSPTYPSDKLAMTYKLGHGDTPPTQSAYIMTPPTEWNDDCRLYNIASVYARLTADPAVYPNGIPNISATIVGHKLYDVDGTPVDYYDNPALILLHYLKNYFGVTNDEINTASFATARDVCNYQPYYPPVEGKRYTCNYTFTLNNKPSKIIEDILKSCYGKLAYSNGQFILKAGAYSTPTVYLNEDDIIGNVSVTTRTSQANAFNSVRGIYIDGIPSNVTNAANQPDDFYTSSFQAADFVPITSSFYLNEDNGIENPIDLELPSVNNHTVARRLAKLTLLDSRQDLTVSLTTKISGIQLIAGDNVYLSLARYGWVNKIFEVSELTINTDLTIGLVLKETATSIYDFPENEDVDRDLSPNTNLPSPFSVQPPFGFSAVETTTVDKDGTVFPSATLSWSASYSGSIADVALEFKNTASANFDALALVSRTDNTFTTLDVVAGNTYMFRARNVNYLGVYSPFVSKSLYIGGDNTAPQTPTNIVATGGSGSFSLTWTNPAVDTDYKFTRIWLNTANNFGGSTLEGTISGTTWNKTISSSSIYYAWLQNIDTSNNTSSVSSPVNATVAAIGAGATGASGSAGNFTEYRYVVYDVTPTISDIYARNPTGTAGNWVSGSIPNANGSAVWVISATISGDGTTVLSPGWQGPSRFSGNVTWYQSTAPTGAITGDWWFNTSSSTVSGIGPRRFARYSGTGWVDANSLITLPDFPSTFQPVNIGNSLPTLPNASYPNGSTFVVTGTGVLYRNDNGTWSAAVTASNLTGQIVGTQISDAAITTPKIAANSITGSQIKADSISSFQIVAGSITTGLIAAGALTASHVGSNTLITNQANIADAVITSAKIVDLTANKITAGTITAAVTMSAAYVSAGTIGAGGIVVSSQNGLRYSDNNGNFIITGGSANGDPNGAQIDLVGQGGGTANNRGVLVLSGCSTATTAESDGRIAFRTGGTETMALYRSGKLTVSGDFVASGTTNRIGDNKYNNTSIELGFYDQANRPTYIDFISSTTSTDYDFRIIRDSGTNGNTSFSHEGNGNIYHNTSGTGKFIFNADVDAPAFNTTSGLKYKTNIRGFYTGLDIIEKLEAKLYDLKDGTKKDVIGLIAEEVNEVLPAIVGKDNEGKPDSIDYSKLTPILLAAIKEQQLMIENLRQRITILERR